MTAWVNQVTQVAAASSELAVARFAASFEYETDCWDVHDALQQPEPGFVLLDVRSPEAFARGHIAGAINLLRGKMTASRLAAYPADTLFVTYCAGPHCNGATKAALVLARMQRPVKIMPGGITGWLDEGFALQQQS